MKNIVKKQTCHTIGSCLRMPPKEKKFVPPLNLTQRSINCLNAQHKSCQNTALMHTKSYHTMIWSGRENFLCAILFTFSTIRLTFKFQTRPHQTSKIKNLQKHPIQDQVNTQPTSIHNKHTTGNIVYLNIR